MTSQRVIFDATSHVSPSSRDKGLLFVFFLAAVEGLLLGSGMGLPSFTCCREMGVGGTTIENRKSAVVTFL